MKLRDNIDTTPGCPSWPTRDILYSDMACIHNKDNNVDCFDPIQKADKEKQAKAWAEAIAKAAIDLMPAPASKGCFTLRFLLSLRITLEVETTQIEKLLNKHEFQAFQCFKKLFETSETNCPFSCYWIRKEGNVAHGKLYETKNLENEVKHETVKIQGALERENIMHAEKISNKCTCQMSISKSIQCDCPYKKSETVWGLSLDAQLLLSRILWQMFRFCTPYTVHFTGKPYGSRVTQTSLPIPNVHCCKIQGSDSCEYCRNMHLPWVRLLPVLEKSKEVFDTESALKELLHLNILDVWVNTSDDICPEFSECTEKPTSFSMINSKVNNERNYPYETKNNSADALCACNWFNGLYCLSAPEVISVAESMNFAKTTKRVKLKTRREALALLLNCFYGTPLPTSTKERDMGLVRKTGVPQRQTVLPSFFKIKERSSKNAQVDKQEIQQIKHSAKVQENVIMLKSQIISHCKCLVRIMDANLLSALKVAMIVAHMSHATGAGAESIFSQWIVSDNSLINYHLSDIRLVDVIVAAILPAIQKISFFVNRSLCSMWDTQGVTSVPLIGEQDQVVDARSTSALSVPLNCPKSSLANMNDLLGERQMPFGASKWKCGCQCCNDVRKIGYFFGCRDEFILFLKAWLEEQKMRRLTSLAMRQPAVDEPSCEEIEALSLASKAAEALLAMGGLATTGASLSTPALHIIPISTLQGHRFSRNYSVCSVQNTDNGCSDLPLLAENTNEIYVTLNNSLSDVLTSQMPIFLQRFTRGFYLAEIVWRSVRLLERRQQYKLSVNFLLLLLEFHCQQISRFGITSSESVQERNVDEEYRCKSVSNFLYKNRAGDIYIRLMLLLEVHLGQKERAFVAGTSCLRERLHIKKMDWQSAAKRVCRLASQLTKNSCKAKCSWDDVLAESKKQEMDMRGWDVIIPKEVADKSLHNKLVYGDQVVVLSSDTGSEGVECEDEQKYGAADNVDHGKGFRHLEASDKSEKNDTRCFKQEKREHSVECLKTYRGRCKRSKRSLDAYDYDASDDESWNSCVSRCSSDSEISFCSSAKSEEKPDQKRRGSDGDASNGDLSDISWSHICPSDVREPLVLWRNERDQLDKCMKIRYVEGTPLNATKMTGRPSTFVGFKGDLLSVEHLCLQEYSLSGNWRGFHDEGRYFRSVFFILLAYHQKRDIRIQYSHFSQVIVSQCTTENDFSSLVGRFTSLSANSSHSRDEKMECVGDGTVKGKANKIKTFCSELVKNSFCDCDKSSPEKPKTKYLIVPVRDSPIIFLPPVSLSCMNPLLLEMCQHEILSFIRTLCPKDVRELIYDAVVDLYGQPLPGVSWAFDPTQLTTSEVLDSIFTLMENESIFEDQITESPKGKKQRVKNKYELSVKLGNIFADLAAAIGGEALAKVYTLFCEDFQYWASGLPDLILWRHKENDKPSKVNDGDGLNNFLRECTKAHDDSSTHKEVDGNFNFVTPLNSASKSSETEFEVLFVEVKGPRDNLSEKQKYWVSELLKAGLDVEICRVAEPKQMDRLTAATNKKTSPTSTANGSLSKKGKTMQKSSARKRKK